jgi:acyl-CoA thioesterase
VTASRGLADVTALESVGDHRYQAVLTPDWAVWGPHGGFLTALALRAAGANTTDARPLSISCDFLAPAEFDKVELETVPLRTTRTSQAVRVTMTQRGRPVMAATVWAAAAHLASPERTWRSVPAVPPPDELPGFDQRMRDAGQEPPPIFNHTDQRPVGWPDDYFTRTGGDAAITTWARFLPDGTFPADPWLDAARSVILTDLGLFPAVAAGLAATDMIFTAPNVNLHVAFHQRRPDHEWLLFEGEGLAVCDGALAARSCIMTADGAVVATGAGQMLYRPLT